MAGMSESEFARRIKRAPSYINKLKEEGRLVFTKDGRVNAPASEKLIEQTGGGRPDVAQRHAVARTATKATEAKKAQKAGQGILGEEKNAHAPTAQASAADHERIGNSMQAARAVKEKYSALKAKAEYETMIGNLVPREDVDAAMRFIGGAVRAAFDVFPDQTSPLVAPVTDLAEIHETLSQACRDALHGIGDAIKRQQDELKGKL